MTSADIIVIVLVVLGCAFFAAGTLGLLRFPDTLSRLHALTKADNVGLGFVCFGLAIHDGTVAGVAILMLVWLLAMFAATISAFLLARWTGQVDDPDGGRS